MATVTTVLGPIAPESLGRTLMHEHVVHHLGALARDDAEPLRNVVVSLATVDAVAARPFSCVDNMTFDQHSLVVAELRALHRAGGESIVDVTTPELGRDVAALRRVAAEAGVNVVAACGHYIASTLPPALASEPTDAIAERFVRELTDGVDATDIRAGMIKVGTSVPLDPLEVKILRAAAIAQGRTGAPISVHLSNLGARRSNGQEVLSVLERAGGDLGKVILGHLDLTLAACEDSAIAHHRELGARGCGLGYDTCGHEGRIELRDGIEVSYPSDAARARAIASLLDAGLRDQVIVSNDICTKVRLDAFRGTGYGHVFAGFERALRAVGLHEEDLDALFVRTPRRLLSW